MEQRGQKHRGDLPVQEQRLPPETAASLRVMHPTSVECVDDMIQLGDLTEASLLRNLHLRHRRGIIYVGDTHLIA